MRHTLNETENIWHKSHRYTSRRFNFLRSTGKEFHRTSLLFSIMEWIFLLLFLINYSSVFKAYEFQCLTCDNFIDGPGCGEFTRQIPVQRCRTFCYFAVLSNRSLATNTFTRAIRDCSPYDDISIEGTSLLQSKIGSIPSSSIEILALKRCNSEQCNNEFYLKSDEFLRSNGSSLPYRRLFVLVLISFSYSKRINT